MANAKKHPIRDLVLTGIAAPLVIVLLILAQAAKVMVRVMTPILYLGQEITALIERMFPPQNGGPLQGFGMTLVIDFILTWIVIWIVLFVMLKLIQKWIDRKKSQA